MSRFHVRRILLEAIGVACVGGLLGLAANAVSPRGLVLSRNYFPSTQRAAATSPGRIVTSETTVLTTNVPGAASTLTRRLEEKGIQTVDTSQVIQLFRDPRVQEGLVMFIDARSDEHYRAGHIPGAYQFFHYRAEKYLETVLPLAQAAQQIVIYCTGGDCEDSEFAAMMLRDMGVPGANLHVYLGGFADWSTNNLPIEVGERLSGNLRNNEGQDAGQ